MLNDDQLKALHTIKTWWKGNELFMILDGAGGTGKSSYTVGSVLYASGTGTIGEILSGTGGAKEGQVLQIVNNLPAYGTLDGGTF